MTLVIRDCSDAEGGSSLVDFDPIADCLEPEARECAWEIGEIEGMLRAGNSAYTLEDAYAYAEASLVSPITWTALRQYTSRYFQIYDCEFRSVGTGPCAGIVVRCHDSTQWLIVAREETLIDRLRRRFKNTIDE